MAEQNLFLINENQEIYQNVAKEDLETQEKKNITKGQRNQVVIGIQNRQKQQETEILLKKEREEEELEMRALQEMEKAAQIKEALQSQKLVTETKKRTRKQKPEKGDIIQDENGNMPLLDFQDDNGEYEKEFEEIYDIKKGGGLKLPDKRNRQAANKPQNRLNKLNKLNKKKLNAKARANSASSDELLDEMDLNLNDKDSDEDESLDLRQEDGEKNRKNTALRQNNQRETKNFQKLSKIRNKVVDDDSDIELSQGGASDSGSMQEENKPSQNDKSSDEDGDKMAEENEDAPMFNDEEDDEGEAHF